MGFCQAIELSTWLSIDAFTNHSMLASIVQRSDIMHIQPKNWDLEHFS